MWAATWALWSPQSWRLPPAWSPSGAAPSVPRTETDGAGRAFRPTAQLGVVHPRLLLPCRPGRRIVRARNVAPALGKAGRRGRCTCRVHPVAAGAGPVPTVADRRPGPARAVLAHADRHRRRRAELQILVAHVRGRLGPDAVRIVRLRLRPGLLPGRPPDGGWADA